MKIPSVKFVLLAAMPVVALSGAVRAGGVPTYSHVLIVVEENRDYGSIIGNTDASTGAPYINNTLLGTYGGVNFTNMHADLHPSEPNYIELFSGSDQGVLNDNVPANLPFTTPNLGAKLLANGKTFNAYGEDLPSVGFTGATSNNYAQKHFPSSYWQASTPTGNELPTSVNVPYYTAADNINGLAASGYFPTTPAGYATLPTVSMVIPNLQGDMHDGTINQGDAWLKNNLDGYASWARTNNSLLIVTWDEDAGDHQVNDQLIATVLEGANLVAGNYSESVTHYSLLRTVEDMYGLGTSGAGDAAATDITDVFATPEPAALSLLGLGSFGLLARRRRN